MSYTYSTSSMIGDFVFSTFLLFQILYEAGRLYGTTEVIRQCTEHEAPLNLFYCCFMPI